MIIDRDDPEKTLKLIGDAWNAFMAETNGPHPPMGIDDTTAVGHMSGSLHLITSFATGALGDFYVPHDVEFCEGFADAWEHTQRELPPVKRMRLLLYAFFCAQTALDGTRFAWPSESERLHKIGDELATMREQLGEMFDKYVSHQT